MFVRALAFALALSMFAVPTIAAAQQQVKVDRIGILSAAGPSPDPSRLAFLQRLQELGWVPGQNLVFETRFAENNLARLPDLANELVQLKVSAILAIGTPASIAAKRATATIPIVFLAGDPVGTKLVASLARPGGNLTGLTIEAGLELVAKRLELLKEVAPKTSRVGILWNPENLAEVRAREANFEFGRALGLTLVRLDVRAPGDFDAAFARARSDRVDALAVAENPLNLERRELIVAFSEKERLPTIFGEGASVRAGGLMSYGADFANVLRQAAEYVGKVLRGAKPADLPVEQPKTFELIVNLKTAKTLGLTVPQSVLIRADQVIE